MRLDGRKALVTGGASGIGAAIAARLAAEGAEVWVGDIDVPGAERVAGEIAGHGIELDVTDLDSARAAIEAAGGVEILVNNAGTDEFGFFPTTSPAQWQRVIDINLNGVFNCTAVALPGMQQASYGRIVSISSEAGRVGSKGSAIYSAAKAGVIGFTKVIARENGRSDITANAIAPGPIETPLLMGAKQLGEVGERLIDNMRSQTQLGRLGQPFEVAAAVAFLASDDATFVTGETLGVSGGLGMV
ncbi:MAG TPA: SDR family NAD(P)-dependent oxidoreductase [Solirubrobacterales bacterium]|nr:SDR family NAD(P)-dependent oxidoreductase [Solirubrobacterales bacterium]